MGSGSGVWALSQGYSDKGIESSKRFRQDRQNIEEAIFRERMA